MNGIDGNNSTHLFISYADEDVVLAKWLARKLASFGYAVWFDQLKMLGGEPWPQTIDDAIKNRTFRMLALMSANSISKPNPTKERTLALRIARQRNISDFLITLRVDNAELDWLTTDISYIAFNQSWADGLRRLVKKLDSIPAPKTLTDGAAIAASTFSIGDELCESTTEQVRANVIRVQTLPDVLIGFEAPVPLTEAQGIRLGATWPYYRIGNSVAIAFCQPTQEYRELIRPTGEQWSWTKCDKVRGVRSRDIVVNLIVRTVQVMLLRARCQLHPKRPGIFYLPADFTEDGQLHFNNFRGKRTWLKIRGKATFWRPGKPSEINFHHFAFQIKLGRGLDTSFWVQVTPSLFFFDEAGNAIVDNRVGPRRRRLTKDWWNGKWVNRLLAAEQILADLSSKAEFGIVLDKAVLSLSSPITINEDKLEDARHAEDKEDPNIEEGQVNMEGGDGNGDGSDE
jgi:TIR domain-containing protein